MRHHTRNSAALIMLASLALAGCGDDTGSGTPTSASSTPVAGFNDADVSFATAMIPHHQQAVQMSEMAARKGSSPALRRLAAQIKAAQGPEISTMSGWLTAWGKPVPGQSHGGHSGHDDTMPGMMTEDELAGLGNERGAAFDRRWMQLMIVHHQGAVTMAKRAQTTARNAAVIALAKRIETDQNREIATMRRMLAR
jgi:uncharacterized protein (DUF305 family)